MSESSTATPIATNEPRRRARKPGSSTQATSQVASEDLGERKGEPKQVEVPLFKTTESQTMQLRGMKMPDMQHGFQTVVHDLFESGFNVLEEYRKIKAALEITDALTPDRLKRAANEQEGIANRAHQLFIIAKVEVQAYLRETEPIYGAIRERAIMELEQEKATGARTKQITDADAKAEAARLFPDEWADICTRRDRAEAMLKQLENLAQLARSRCYTVSAMAHPGARSM